MRNLKRILLVSSGAAVLGLLPSRAHAQNDITPHLPNVLLLIDSSGSMEYLVGADSSGNPVSPESGSAPAGSACVIQPTSTTATTNLNRWSQLVTTLTGTIPTGPNSAFGCEALDRSSTGFANEYGWPSGSKPYDYGYYLPFHRIYSNGCTVGVGSVPSNWDWSQYPNFGTAFDFHTSAGTCASNAANCCTWGGQYNDGLLDTFAGLVRFGFMTFDTLPDPGTGAVPGASPPQVNTTTAMAGMWSYFHGWQTYNSGSTASLPGPPAAGEPANCSTPRFMEVGARNAAAPPWEGPMIPFGDPNSDTGIQASNTAIQWQILAMRPYGATPLAGMLDDAREFLFHDDTKIPGTTQDFGPRLDPYWVNGCRKTYVILLTDGEPNMDLRGATGNCDASGAPNGVCPYDLPENIIKDMATTGAPTPNQKVTTYVVGFALPASGSGKTSCTQVNPATDCTSPPAGLKTCCTLDKLAQNGGTGPMAYFADNAGQLKSALSAILSSIVGSTTARTSPVYAPAGQAAAQGANLSSTPASSYHFAASFNVTSAGDVGNNSTGVSGGLWTGNLTRERYQCVSGLPQAQPVTTSLGDDFRANLDSDDAGHPRQIWTVVGSLAGSVVNSDNSIRPFLPADDGFGTYGWDTSVNPIAPTSESTFPLMISTYPLAFGINNNQKSCKDAFGTTSANTCTQLLMNYEIGITNSLPAALMPAISRDPASAYCQPPKPPKSCSKLGAIYHSTPAISKPPNEYLRDDSYVAYANTSYIAKQPTVLYTATIDGQLHAFKVSANDPNDTYTVDKVLNNELWSFFPPAVLQHLMSNYNTGGAQLLDGAPVIADVPGQTTLGTLPPVFQRSSGSATQWHRVLVASGGPAGGPASGFYYALDVTVPTQPQFLWQLSTDDQGNNLFGDITPTAAITSVALNINNTRTQVPVAILSGGYSTTAKTCNHPPSPGPHPNIILNDANNPSNPGGGLFNIASFQAPPLRCWGKSGLDENHQVKGNSLSIVRLDNGQIIAHFVGTFYKGSKGFGHQGGGDNGDNGKSNNTYVVGFNAPISGVPAIYPGQAGQVAQAIYVGDADGQLWRIDVTDTNPDNWTVALAWDSYLDSPTSSREMIQIAPVLASDPVGNLAIEVATGDQNLLTSTSNDNRVWSLTETPLLHNTSQNWMIKFPTGGPRVTGPMSVFNEVLYFATYAPQTGNVCADGYGSLWAVDFRRPNPSSTPYAGLPFGELPPPNPYNPNVLHLDGTPGTLIMGVQTAETPSCSDSQVSNDAYFGQATQATGVGASEYRLMWQTGSGSGISNSAVQNEAGIGKMQYATLPPPGQATIIDSWGAVVE